MAGVPNGGGQVPARRAGLGAEGDSDVRVSKERGQSFIGCGLEGTRIRESTLLRVPAPLWTV